jgi:hypothetical protein
MTAAGISVGTQLIGGVIGSNAASDAANQISAADTAAANQANSTISTAFDKTASNIQPYIAAGQTAVGQMSSGTQTGGAFDPTHQFSMADFTQDPGYNFDLSQGSLALQRSAAANGTLMSGGTLKDLTTYSQGMASNEFANAYNRWNTTRQNNFGNLSQIANLGSTANSQYGTFSGAAANQESQNTMAGVMGAGAAQAAGTIGSANALTGALTGAGNTGMQAASLNAFMNKSSYGSAPATTTNSWAPWGQPGYVNPGG